jgi:predicted porin
LLHQSNISALFLNFVMECCKAVWFNSGNFPKTEVGSGKSGAPVQTLENLEMKKTLVAIAALAAFGAQAQSSVTMYGVVDAGLFSTKGGDVSTVVLTNGAHTSSRLGFKGTEDIGGGLKGNFGLEAGLAVDNGGLGGASGNTSATAGTNQIFSRGSFVGLEGGFGKINAGKISTHSNSHILAYTPGTTNIAAVSFRTAATTSSGWLDNTIEYVSPSIYGLTARVLHTTGNSKATGAEGITDATKKQGNGQEFGLSYANGPLAAGIYTAQRKTIESNTDKAKTSAIGATYDFRVAKVGMTVNESDPTPAANDKIKGTSFGVTVPVNAAVTLAGFLGQAKTQAGGKSTFTSVNLDYALSKRTIAYANYTTVDNNLTGAANLAGMGTGNASPVAAVAAGKDASAMGVGIRHSF